MNMKNKIIKILKIQQAKQIRNRDRQEIIIKELQCMKERAELNAYYNNKNWEYLKRQINAVKVRGNEDLASLIERSANEQQETIEKFVELIRNNRGIIMDVLRDEQSDENYVNEKIEEWIKYTLAPKK